MKSRRFKSQLVVLLLLFGICSSTVYAQHTGPEQDCIHAIPISQPQFVQDKSYQGIGNLQEINNNSCLETGENNSVWYTFTMVDSGRLEFSIIPDNPEDFDFALFKLNG